MKYKFKKLQKKVAMCLVLIYILSVPKILFQSLKLSVFYMPYFSSIVNIMVRSHQ
jgi:hypothetical protein